MNVAKKKTKHEFATWNHVLYMETGESGPDTRNVMSPVEEDNRQELVYVITLHHPMAA